jgi:urease accessory protein
MSLGAAFLTAVGAGWPSDILARLSDPFGGRFAYPVAVAVSAAAHDLPLSATLAAMIKCYATTLVSVAVRLVTVGQTAGLEVLANILPVVLAVAQRAAESSLDDLGSAAILSDIAAMRHETLYSRIFRS